MKVLDTNQKPGDLFWALGLIILGVWIYGYSLNNGFLWDDSEYVLQNPSMNSLTGLLKFWSISNSPLPFPLTLSGFWLEHKLWGFNPWGYHTVSLTFHILNGLLLFGLVRRLKPSLAGITALLFTIHPIQVETVAWIAEQKNLLCLFFFILAFHAFLDFSASHKKTNYAKMLLFFIAALASKCTASCFATVPLIYAWWKWGRISRRDLLLTLPLFFLGALSTFFPIFNESADAGSQNIFFIERILLAGKTFLFYIKQIALPWQFLTLYPKWNIHMACVGNWLFPLAVIALYIVLYRCRHRIGRGAFALLCFYGISIFPALGFLKLALHQATFATDHFSYLSTPPILLLCCAAAHSLSSKIQKPSTPGSSRLSSFLRKSAVAAVVLYLSLLSFRLTLNYKNAFILWGQLLRQDPQSFFAYNHLGVFMLENPGFSKPKQTISLFQKAISLNPDYTDAYLNLGLAYEKTRAYDKAVDTYLQAIKRAAPHSQIELYYRIGDIYLLQDELDKAFLNLNKAVDLHTRLTAGSQKLRIGNIPCEKSLYSDLGKIYLRKKEYSKAVGSYRKAILLDSQSVGDYIGLGKALWNSGDTQNALRAYQKAHLLDPQNKNIGDVLAMMQKIATSARKKLSQN